jgi:VanZ family protein
MVMNKQPDQAEPSSDKPLHWWQPASALAAVLLVAGLFVGGAQPVAVGLVNPPWDKVLHASVFGVLAVLLGVALRGAHLLHGRQAIGVPQALLWAALLSLTVGGADEIHQLSLPGRMAGWDDWLADATGIALGLGALRWFWQPSHH